MRGMTIFRTIRSMAVLGLLFSAAAAQAADYSDCNQTLQYLYHHGGGVDFKFDPGGQVQPIHPQSGNFQSTLTTTGSDGKPLNYSKFVYSEAVTWDIGESHVKNYGVPWLEKGESGVAFYGDQGRVSEVQHQIPYSSGRVEYRTARFGYDSDGRCYLKSFRYGAKDPNPKLSYEYVDFDADTCLAVAAYIKKNPQISDCDKHLFGEIPASCKDAKTNAAAQKIFEQASGTESMLHTSWAVYRNGDPTQSARGVPVFTTPATLNFSRYSHLCQTDWKSSFTAASQIKANARRAALPQGGTENERGSRAGAADSPVLPALRSE